MRKFCQILLQKLVSTSMKALKCIVELKQKQSQQKNPVIIWKSSYILKLNNKYINSLTVKNNKSQWKLENILHKILMKNYVINM